MLVKKWSNKWIVENDRSLNITLWLTKDHECVEHMKCSVCIHVKDKLVNRQKFSSAFSRNLHT